MLFAGAGMKRFCRALLLFAIAAGPSVAMQAQTFTVLHTFLGAPDGALPDAGLSLDHAGNLYGTTSYGGLQDMGSVFKLTSRPTGWAFTTLYSLTGGSDGATPEGGVIFGPDGSLYGTASFGGSTACDFGCGTVFNLKPQPRVCNTTACPWQETTLYQFTNAAQADPWGNLHFDAAGNIYGTTIGTSGTVYKLTPGIEGWNYSLVHFFDFLGPAYRPYGGVISDAAGNLYGTTFNGGEDQCYQLASCGTVFELSPVGSSWHLKVLHDFDGSDGGNPTAGLIFDHLGNLYGVNTWGTVFTLTPSGGNWTFSVLYQLPGPCGLPPGSLCGPWSALAMDADGALYGTTYALGAFGYGNVFKLTPSNGSWIYTDLHDFTNGSDGSYPIAGVTLDASGKLYGTTTLGGSSGRVSCLKLRRSGCHDRRS